MADLYRIMVRCPNTQERVDSGLTTTGREALNSTIYRDGKVSCPHCQELHPIEGNALLELVRSDYASAPWRPNK